MYNKQFSYEELCDLRDALAGDDDYQLLSEKIVRLLDESWFPGSALPPMHARFLIKGRNSDKEYIARRVALADSYSPHEVILLVGSEKPEEIKFKAGEFTWRYL